MKAALFDLDNTIIDFMRMKRQSCDAAVSAMISAGLKIDKDRATKTLFRLYDKHGIEYSMIFQEFLQELDGKIDHRILAHGIIAYRRAQLSLVEPYPGVVPTLLRLRERGYKLAIVTDAPRLKAWLRLVEMRLDDFFDTVITLDDTGECKPSEKPFRLALESLGVPPENAFFVGDWPERDVLGARALGIRTVFARYGYVRKDKPTVKADYELSRFEDLLKILA
jgi:HAD superfamily hydrolase (TIGR02253 family)